MNAIILCGGLSTRLGEITKDIPKSLLDIRGKAMLDWQLEKLNDLGVKEVVLAAGHLAEVLQQEVGNERGGLKIIYAIEPQRLGTGGAIKFAWDNYVPDNGEPTFVLNGDILASADFAGMTKFLRPESDGIILGAMVDDASTYGVLDFDENYHLKRFKEKEGIVEPGYINGGIYLFNDKFRNYFPDSEVFSIEYDVFPNVKDLDVYKSDRPWIDIGKPDRLQWARNNWQ
ncbi:MAG: sugar phosphate nucleotidyltransferase [Patescibacteria group bacterium]|jgi:NDP-sugar pyrophosphorylase family protein